jgi:hypothetical protein
MSSRWKKYICYILIENNGLQVKKHTHKFKENLYNLSILHVIYFFEWQNILTLQTDHKDKTGNKIKYNTELAKISSTSVSMMNVIEKCPT